MPYSPNCSTVLSNFEANSNFKNTKDPALYVTFPLVEDPSIELVAWTTTPWTLPSNLAAAVNPDFDYIKLLNEESGKTYIIADCRLKEFKKDNKQMKKLKTLEKFKGTTLVGKRYTPLFDYFKDRSE